MDEKLKSHDIVWIPIRMDRNEYGLKRDGLEQVYREKV